jgi:hypothetical protein
MMHSTASSLASSSLPAATQAARHTRPSDDFTYQAVTVAAIVLLLGSLWIF